MALGKTSGLLKDGDLRGAYVHPVRDWHPGYFEMDWVRYCEEELYQWKNKDFYNWVFKETVNSFTFKYF